MCVCMCVGEWVGGWVQMCVFTKAYEQTIILVVVGASNK